ncbi:MAG: hypothetical protein JSS49_15710 [Planctomycetes bacterium]|nr:hypothetical protein [Planctomycetota bacterium]
MIRQFLLLLLMGISTVALLCDAADARSYRRRGRGRGYGGVQTPQSAAGHAMAAIIRSKGMYNLATSRAMVNVEQARSKYIDNQRNWTEVHLQRQRALQSQHAADAVAARAKVERYNEYLAANSPEVPRLTHSQLDPATGRITWPTVLKSDLFSDHRRQIESMFSAQAHHGVTADGSSQLHTNVHAMQAELRDHIHEFDTTQYLQARTFLDSLAVSGNNH